MAYVRKTFTEWQVHVDYGQGPEEVTAEPTRRAALQRMREYRENMPEYPCTLIARRVRIERTPLQEVAP